MAFIRQWGMQRLLEGASPDEVAAWLDVQARSVRRWRQAFDRAGWNALAPACVPGRPPKLDPEQQAEVLAWLQASPTDWGFESARWTARRLAAVIADRWGVHFHPRALNTWLAARGISPQRPQRRFRQRDPAAIARWQAEDWPRIKKTPGAGAPP